MARRVTQKPIRGGRLIKDENGKAGNNKKIRGGRTRRMRMKILSWELEEFPCGLFHSMYVPILIKLNLVNNSTILLAIGSDS